MPSSTLIPFLWGLGSPISPLEAKRAPFFNPRLLGSLGPGLGAVEFLRFRVFRVFRAFRVLRVFRAF